MTKTDHHHGALREALIQAGLEILETEGFAGLTLRKAAARAGVSHAAPAHHFSGKQGLFEAIAARGFLLFREFMESERYATGDTPRDQLAGISRGYIHFSQEHPALFRLIFSVEFKNSTAEELQNASAHAYGLLEDVCALFAPSPDGEGVNEIKVWSVVHGYATLSQFHRGRSPVTGEPLPIEILLPELKAP